jgi:hypothetical protein
MERILTKIMPIVALVVVDLLDMAVLPLTLAPSQHRWLVRRSTAGLFH